MINTELIQDNIAADVKLTNSFGIDVSAAGYIELDTLERLREFAGTDYVRSGGAYMVLSGGNNVLFCGNYAGVILHPTSKSIDIIEQDDSCVKVRVEAGVEWDDFVAWCVEHNLWGVENLSLIPGYVGAAPIQNIGAYGVEVKDVVSQVEVFDMTTLDTKMYPNDKCNFAYRESIFKRQPRGKVVVVAVVFELSKVACARLQYGDLQREVAARGGATLSNIRDAVVAIRQSKLPDTAELGNAGSFFKNPVVDKTVAERICRDYENVPCYPSAQGEDMVKLAAGWLIEKAGFKGLRHGNVGVHQRQALVLVNYGGATGQEIITFAEQIRDGVNDQFGITLEFEVNIIR